MTVMIDHLTALRERQLQFLGSIPLVDAATPVPWCGRWKVRNLVEHLARVHHWAAGQARRRPEVALGRGPFELTSFYATQADELFDTLRELDPDAPAWTLADDGVPREQRTGTVRFWHRRQALETLVHLWDLRTAGGLDYEADDEAWADCLDEVVTVMHPRQLRLARVQPPPVRVRFVATDAAVEFDLAGAPPDAHEVTVTGTVRSLALLAWGRLPITDTVIVGDDTALEAVLAAGLTP